MRPPRRLGLAFVLSLLCAPSPVRAASLTVAVALLGDAGPGRGRIEAAMADAIGSLSTLKLANPAKGGRLSDSGRSELELRADPAAARAFGRTLGVSRVLLAEAVPLGDSLVLYLNAVEVRSGKALGTATVTLPASGKLSSEASSQLRAAIVAVLDPARNLGKVVVRVDVPTAEVLVDGKKVKAREVELPVGTHTLRVTHPAYRDFLRFVEVDLGKESAFDVALSAYPLTEGEMAERARAARSAAPPGRRVLPWYRRWWALTAAGAVLLGATTAAVYFTRPGLSPDNTATYRPVPVP